VRFNRAIPAFTGDFAIRYQNRPDRNFARRPRLVRQFQSAPHESVVGVRPIHRGANSLRERGSWAIRNYINVVRREKSALSPIRCRKLEFLR
jgi:hypothetical protein